MKANRKFREAEEAVSAVIGVILMVAITVAIAATVYVYVSGMIGTSPETTPTLQLVRDTTNVKLTVASADPGNLQWSSFNVTIHNTTSGAAQPYIYPVASGQLTGGVKAGDIIQVGNPGYTYTVTIRHISTNTLVGTWDFN
jgi:flagellin-like protein